MPRRPFVTIKRWQAAGAFLVLATVSVLGSFWTHNASVTAHHAAVRADRIALANRYLLKREHADRLARRKQSLETFVLICQKQNQSNAILADLLQRISKFPSSPPTTRLQASNRKALFRLFAKELRRLQPRKCSNLPATKKVPPK